MACHWRQCRAGCFVVVPLGKSGVQTDLACPVLAGGPTSGLIQQGRAGGPSTVENGPQRRAGPLRGTRARGLRARRQIGALKRAAPK
eukprot:2897317-Pyramimonas_sp.AAC.1